ncbi:MAG: ACT domain-containing protein, partial [Verrucomicrobiales bacterium]
MKESGLILKIDCPDQPGIVAKLASYASLHGGNLTEFSQFTDSRGGRFFARLEVNTGGLDVEVDDFISGFGTLGQGLNAR